MWVSDLYQLRYDVEIFSGDIMWCWDLHQLYYVMSRSLSVILWHRGLCQQYWVMLRSLRISCRSYIFIFGIMFSFEWACYHLWGVTCVFKFVTCEQYLYCVLWTASQVGLLSVQVVVMEVRLGWKEFLYSIELASVC